MGTPSGSYIIFTKWSNFCDCLLSLQNEEGIFSKGSQFIYSSVDSFEKK